MTDDPQANNRKDLRRFYSDLASKDGWRHLGPFLEKLDSLLQFREEKGLFTFTSHELLCFTRHPAYPAWADDDRVAIAPLRTGQVEVAYVTSDPPQEEKVVVGYDNLIATVSPLLARLKEPNQPPQTTRAFGPRV